MSGPIVRSGPSPEFSDNWENVFGKKKGAAAKSPSKASASGAKKPAAKKKVAKKKAAGKKKK